MCASQILETEKPLSFYIGLCKAPSLRFYEEPGPHCMRYTKMYVLSVGENMKIKDKQMISYFRDWSMRMNQRGEHQYQISNKSMGGGGISPKSVRFLYLCLKMAKPRSELRTWFPSDTETELEEDEEDELLSGVSGERMRTQSSFEGEQGVQF